MYVTCIIVIVSMHTEGISWIGLEISLVGINKFLRLYSFKTVLQNDHNFPELILQFQEWNTDSFSTAFHRDYGKCVRHFINGSNYQNIIADVCCIIYIDVVVNSTLWVLFMNKLNRIVNRYEKSYEFDTITMWIKAKKSISHLVYMYVVCVSLGKTWT